MSDQPCRESNKENDTCDVCDVYEKSSFTDQTLALNEDECEQRCSVDKNCKAAYHNNYPKNPQCFLTKRQTYEVYLYDPSFSTVFHRNSSQFCNQDRIACVMNGEDSSRVCTIKMNACLVSGPGEIPMRG